MNNPSFKKHEQSFSIDELNAIRAGILFNAKYTRRDTDQIVVYGGLRHMPLPILYDKLRNIIGHDDYTIRAARYHIQFIDGLNNIHSEGNPIYTKKQRNGVPADALLSLNDRTWRTFLIPLSDNGSTVYFNQRYHGHDNVEKYNGTGYELEGYKPGFNVSEGDYQQYLSHVPRAWLDGLSIATVYKWNAGDITSNESIQLHVPGALPTGFKEVIVIKVGLL